MNLLKYLRRSKPVPAVRTKETYNFLVVAALQEELDEFYKTSWKNFSKKEAREAGAYEVTYQSKKERVRILTFSPNVMGMPMTAASIMNIISIHNPTYVFLIGTCACLNTKHKLGDVIVPARVFSYESGKYEGGVFKPDYVAHSTGEDLRKEAQHLFTKNNWSHPYKVIADEDLCSGSAVINDGPLAEEIRGRCGRKLSGLDMEAYSIACINTISKGGRELTVVKSFSDYAVNKGEAEEKGNKELAKKNSAHFTLLLIKHLHETKFGSKAKYPL
jgi:nucleoside phosphorylase